MSSPTPGPWTANGTLIQGPNREDVGYALWNVGKAHTAADVDAAHAHAVANARLMAAAPDLYEALLLLDEAAAERCDPTYCRRCAKAYDKTRAVLDKVGRVLCRDALHYQDEQP